MKAVVTDEMIEIVREMIDEHSYAEIASRLNLSVRCVNNLVKRHDIKRSRDAESTMRSRIRKNLVKGERRRAIFGLEQHTNLKVFMNPERRRLKVYLKRMNYKIPTRGSMTVYYDDHTQRVDDLEERGRKVGLTFERFETVTN